MNLTLRSTAFSYKGAHPVPP